jgi:hypothetical protein
MSNTLDYSPHIIASQQGLKRMYSQLVRHDYDKSLEEGTQALVELRLALVAIQDIREKARTRS